MGLEFLKDDWNPFFWPLQLACLPLSLFQETAQQLFFASPVPPLPKRDPDHFKDLQESRREHLAKYASFSERSLLRDPKLHLLHIAVVDDLWDTVAMKDEWGTKKYVHAQEPNISCLSSGVVSLSEVSLPLALTKSLEIFFARLRDQRTNSDAAMNAFTVITYLPSLVGQSGFNQLPERWVFGSDDHLFGSQSIQLFRHTLESLQQNMIAEPRVHGSMEELFGLTKLASLRKNSFQPADGPAGDSLLPPVSSRTTEVIKSIFSIPIPS